MIESLDTQFCKFGIWELAWSWGKWHSQWVAWLSIPDSNLHISYQALLGLRSHDSDEKKGADRRWILRQRPMSGSTFLILL